jgi:cysteine synthase A
LIQRGLAKVRELASEPNTFWTQQFENPDNRAGYHAMGHEILTELGNVDAFVMGVGTGGCFSGNSEVLKAANPSTRCVAVEPEKCRALAGVGPYLGHRLEGMGAGFVPGGCRQDLMDEIVTVSDEDAFETARRLWREEGIYCGPTAGANVFSAIGVARALGPRKRVVTVICDSGLKYLAGDLVGA